MPEQSYLVPDTEHTAEYRGGVEVGALETSTLTDMARAAVERSFNSDSGEYQLTPEQREGVAIVEQIGVRIKGLREEFLKAA